MSVLEEAAIAWWKRRRPLGWTAEMHIANPTINCTSDEYDLAKQASYLVKEIRAHEFHMDRTPEE